MDLAKHIEATMLLLDAVACQKKAVNAMQAAKGRMAEENSTDTITLPMEDFVAMTKGAVLFSLLTAGITGSRAEMKAGLEQIARGETPSNAQSVKQMVELIVKGMTAITEDNATQNEVPLAPFPFNHITPEGKVE